MGCSPGRMIVLVESGSVFSFANLHRHYLGCRKGKRNTYNALRFEARQERRVFCRVAPCYRMVGACDF